MSELHRRSPDSLLLFSVMGLAGFGIVMIYSSSSVVALEMVGDPAYFAKRQAIWFAFGLAGLWFASRIHYSFWRTVTPVLLLVAGALLVLVLVPGIGRVINGARRWISVGGVLQFQPVEVAKLALVFYLANFLANRRDGIRSFGLGLLPPLLVLGLFAVLIMRQPDMGSAMILVLIAFTTLFAAGARPIHLMLVALAGAPVVLYLALHEAYRRERLLAFLNPWNDAQGIGFHIIQSLLAIGSGGLFGLGLGRSHQKFLFLPERHTDFIFAILAEELGLIGVAAVISLYGVFVARALRAALRAPDRYGALLGTGLVCWIAGQTVVNIGVVSGSLPVTGVPLPFLSSGGTSLFVLLIAAGILLNLSQYARAEAAVDVERVPAAGARRSRSS
jgi:cell division protein FtsW